jgi:hypothetical protein
MERSGVVSPQKPPVPGRTPEQQQQLDELNKRLDRELVDNLNRNVLAGHVPS